MAERVKLAEFDIPPTAGAHPQNVTEQAMRRHYWRTAQVTFPDDIDFEVMPYGETDATGFLVTIYEQPNLPEEQTA